MRQVQDERRQVGPPEGLYWIPLTAGGPIGKEAPDNLSVVQHGEYVFEFRQVALRLAAAAGREITGGHGFTPSRTDRFCLSGRRQVLEAGPSAL